MRKILTILISALFFANAFSQSGHKELFEDAEFFLLSEDYADALPSYKALYQRGHEKNYNVLYRMGICYLNLPGEKSKAVEFLELASQNTTLDYKEGTLNETKAPIDAFIFLGNAYRINNELDKAIIAYKKFKSFADPNDDDVLIYYTDKQIEACNQAKELKKNPLKLEYTNLGENINSSYSNFRPVISGDEEFLIYMSELKFYDAIFFSKKVDGEWSNPTNITPQIRSDGDQYTTALSYDGTTLYLAKEDFFNSDIFTSTYSRGRWSVSQPLNKSINTKYWESHACVSKDDKELYFTSNRKDKNAMGAMDIYVSRKDANGEWGDAENLGSTINTDFNEEAPFITPDGKRLYFSSQGHNTMGGYDIFYSEKQPDGSWGKPVNVGFPISTTDDDMYFLPVGDGTSGYISHYSKDGFGEEDIYKVAILKDTSMADNTLMNYLKERANINSKQ